MKKPMLRFFVSGCYRVSASKTDENISTICEITSANLELTKWPVMPRMRTSLAVKSFPVRIKLSRLRPPSEKSASIKDSA